MQHSSAAIAVLCSVVSSSAPGDFISEAGGVAGYLVMHIDNVSILSIGYFGMPMPYSSTKEQVSYMLERVGDGGGDECGVKILFCGDESLSFLISVAW